MAHECSGRWIKGSGGHRIHDERDCPKPGIWNWADGGWYCEDHEKYDPYKKGLYYDPEVEITG